MYKAIIVDDELWILRGLKKLIDWNSLGFESPEIFTDSAEALENITKHKPNLLITDIRMAGLTGIELMKSVMKLDISIKFVVISGYSEFEYAHEALKIGALDYLLKPITPENLYKIIQKVKNILDAETRSKKDYSSMENIESILNFFKSVAPLYSKDIILNKLHLNGRYANYICAVISDKSAAQSIVQELNTSYQQSSCFDINKRDSLIIFNFQKNFKDTILNFIMSKANNTNLKAGISDEISDVLMITEAIEHASCSYNYSFLYPGENFHTYKNENSNLLKFYISEFDLVLEQKNIDKVHIIIDQIPSFLKKHDLASKSLVILYNHIAESINRLLLEYNLDLNKTMTIVDYVHMVDEFKDINKMLSFIHENLHSTLENINGAITQTSLFYNTNKTIISRVKQYLDDNFKSDITLGLLSQKFLIDERYLSQLFKAETGETFVNYLTNLRIQHACSLIENTDLSINDISYLCGYKDYFYFNKVFKKVMGITPSYYRINSK